jgi:hypothetical protein
MAADYPGAIKTFTDKVDLQDFVSATDINDAYAEIEAIEGELGINPAGSFSTVVLALAQTMAEKAATKGDLLVATGANAASVLPVASKKYSLMYADSAEATGLKYGAIRYVELTAFDYTTDCATGDGKAYLHIPAQLDGLDLVEVHAECITAGTTGTMDIQIYNIDNALDMLSTKLTIDSAETGSDTAATAAVINTSNDHVNVNDMLRIDVDAVHTTEAKGLIVTLGFA